MRNEKLKVLHGAARKIAIITNEENIGEIEKLDFNYQVLNVRKLKNNKYYNDVKIIFDNLNAMYSTDDINQHKLQCENIINACNSIRKIRSNTVILILTNDMKTKNDLFNHACDELISNITILAHEFEKISPSTPASESKQEVLPFDLELENSKDLNDAIEKYENELRSLNNSIWNLKKSDPSVTNPKVKILESYHHQMARINKTDITNVDIGTLQLKRVNFKLKNSEYRDAKIKDESMIHAQASSRPILGAILLTGAVLLGLTSIALCLTIKLAPIGLVGLALATKLFMAGTTMTTIGLGGTSAYFFSAKIDLTKKTDSTLAKLRVI